MTPAESLNQHAIAVISSVTNLVGLGQVQQIVGSISQQAQQAAAKARAETIARFRAEIAAKVKAGKARKVTKLTPNSFVFGKNTDGSEFAQHVHQFPAATIAPKVLAIEVPGEVEIDGVKLKITEAYDEVTTTEKANLVSIAAARKQGRGKKGRR